MCEEVLQGAWPCGRNGSRRTAKSPDPRSGHDGPNLNNGERRLMFRCQDRPPTREARRPALSTPRSKRDAAGAAAPSRPRPCRRNRARRAMPAASACTLLDGPLLVPISAPSLPNSEHVLPKSEQMLFAVFGPTLVGCSLCSGQTWSSSCPNLVDMGCVRATSGRSRAHSDASSVASDRIRDKFGRSRASTPAQQGSNSAQIWPQPGPA